MLGDFGAFEYALAERYRFERELGRGAMGTVYRAQDLLHDRPVAIKVLHASLTNDIGAQRFQAEIHIAARLAHAHIVTVYASGSAGDRLFYVMPYLGGESLRERLRRDKQLSPADAITIAQHVGAGLQFAHEQGVVHRDIKPENIILADGQAHIVDFGLARALSSSDADRLTMSGLSVGTPAYLSPEQAAAERHVGPAADQYALACVLYEMLAGEPPFTGPTANALALRHLSDAPAPLRTRRKATPPSVAAAVSRALEKVPTDRFPSTRDFVAALTEKPTEGDAPPPPPPPVVRRRLTPTALVGGSLLVVALVVAGISAAWPTVGCALSACADTSRVVVFPLAGPLDTGSAFDARLRDALTRWSGVSSPSTGDLQAAIAQAPHPLTLAGARSVARSLGAGRFVLSEATRDGLTRRVDLALHDAADRRGPRTVTVTVQAAPVPDTLIEWAAYRLLFDGADARRWQPLAQTTRDRDALVAYLRGRAAMRTWNLPAAVVALRDATTRDDDFAAAWLALAQVHSWQSDQPADVRADLAHVRSLHLLPWAERVRAVALDSLTAGRFAAACARYDSLATRDSTDFDAWYGLSECNRRDKAVVVDLRSPSGRRFRGSAHRAATAVTRAFTLIPAVDSCCLARADALLRRVLHTDIAGIRFGSGVSPDTLRYGAYPALHDDTIAFIPLPLEQLNRPPPASHPQAVERERATAYEIAVRRLARTPSNADALAELGEAMVELGYDGAADTIRQARLRTAEPSQQIRLAVDEIWIRVRRSIPDNRTDLVVARHLADSVLTVAHPVSFLDDSLLSSLAALTGHTERAATYATRSATTPDTLIHPAVTALGTRLLIYAASGGPVDSIRALEASVASAIASRVVPSHQSFARTMWLHRPLELAFPVYRSSWIVTSAASSGVVAAQAAFHRDRPALVRQLLAATARARVNMRPSDLTIDRLYSEAWLWAAMGDTAAALRTIGPTLDALRYAPPRQYFTAVQAAALVRAILLRADLLRGRDATESRRWASVVGVLMAHPTTLPALTTSR